MDNYVSPFARRLKGEWATFQPIPKFGLLRCIIWPDEVGQMFIGGVTMNLMRLPWVLCEQLYA